MSRHTAFFRRKQLPISCLKNKLQKHMNSHLPILTVCTMHCTQFVFRISIRQRIFTNSICWNVFFANLRRTFMTESVPYLYSNILHIITYIYICIYIYIFIYIYHFYVIWMCIFMYYICSICTCVYIYIYILYIYTYTCVGVPQMRVYFRTCMYVHKDYVPYRI